MIFYYYLLKIKCFFLLYINNSCVYILIGDKYVYLESKKLLPKKEGER